MHAAVVTAFDTPPRYASFPDPTPSGPHQVTVDVLAAGLHPRVRSQADGSHYTSTSELPLTPGIDGVGRTAAGELRYFVLEDTTLGAMAERTVIDLRRSIALPADADPVRIAAAMNPAMSSWVALQRRISFSAGSSVLVLGATGSAGRMAVQVARLLGAGSVIAAGRDLARLAAVPADVTVSLSDPELGVVAGDVDVVLDYVWGAATASVMAAVVTHRRDRGRPLTWVEIGSAAGPSASIPSAALRAARLQIVGSGQGSVATADILASLPVLASYITDGTLVVDARTVRLADVGSAWTELTSDRLVVVP